MLLFDSQGKIAGIQMGVSTELFRGLCNFSVDFGIFQTIRT